MLLNILEKQQQQQQAAKTASPATKSASSSLLDVQPSHVLQNHQGAINQIILQDGHLITSSSDGKITIWDGNTRTVLHEFRGDSKRLVLRKNILYCVSFGNFGNEPGVVSAYSIPRKCFVAVYKGHALFITDMLMIDDVMYTSSADHTIRAWDTERSDGGATTDGGPEERKTRKVYYGHSGIVNVLAWSQAFGILFSGSADFTVKAWRDGVNITTYSGHQASVTALEVTNSGQLFSGSNDETIRCWDVRTGACTYVIKVKGATVNGLLCTPEGLLAWTSDFFVSHFNAKSGKRVRSYEGHTGKILQWRLDPAQAYLYTASADGTVRRWNLRRGHCAAIFRGHKDLVHSILIASTAGQLYSGSSDTTTLIWDIPPDQAAGGGPSEDGSDDSEYDDFGMPLPHHSRPKRTSTERDRRISSERDRRVSSERDRAAADTARAPASQAAASSSSGPSRVETWMDFLSSTTSTSPSALTGKDASGKKDKKEKKEKKDKGKDKGTVSATPSPVSKVGSSI